MKLYVNGDSHSAGAEAVNNYCFAIDDPKLWELGRVPHPDNLAVSYGKLLADRLDYTFECEAESASSNTRIIRSTRDYLKESKPDLVIIGWSTWEREEWFHNDSYFQVTASGTDHVPKELAEQYKQWVINTVDRSAENELFWHNEIYKFHNELNDLGIKHLFFNTYRYFAHIKLNNLPKYDWDNSYIDPYDQNYTYYYWLKNNGFNTVNSQSYHFGADAHAKWADFLHQHLTTS
jgi:hypothetical protein